MGNLEIKQVVRDDESDSNIIDASETQKASDLYFKDKKRKIDFVLAYEDSANDDANVERTIFENELKAQGLEMELEDKTHSLNGTTYFLKLHAPWKVLTKYAEYFNMRKPIKNQESKSLPVYSYGSMDKYVFAGRRHRLFTKIMISNKDFLNYFYFAPDILCYDKTLIPDEPVFLCAPFRKDCQNRFFIQNRDMFFLPSECIAIVWDILKYTMYSKVDTSKRGIHKLLKSKIYTAAYPLHDGPCEKGKFKRGKGIFSDRRILYSEWARLACLFKMQPLHLIRRYLGFNVGLSFAWMSLYIKMLMPLSILGILTFCYGVAEMDAYIPNGEICNPFGMGNVTMCPICDKTCRYWRLVEGCLTSKVSRLFENEMTVLFSIVVNIWACVFIKLWRRQEDDLVSRWNLSKEDLYMIRIGPEDKHLQKSYVDENSSQESKTRFSVKQKRTYFVTINNFLFMLALIGDFALGVEIYMLSTEISLRCVNNEIFKEPYAAIQTVIGAVLNICIIIILDQVYNKIALLLTIYETPHPERNFQASLTIRMFFFQFINMYAPFIYIALFKQNIFTFPSSNPSSLGYQSEECILDGCLTRIGVQLGIFVMVKYFAFNALKWIFKKMKQYFCRKFHVVGEVVMNCGVIPKRWEDDYALKKFNNNLLFEDYMEMMTQFGFVTLFAAAFPLAPLITLIYNIIKLRLLAKKIITEYQRPVSVLPFGEGVWISIVRGISIFSVITNAFLVSFTSNIVTGIIYTYLYSPDGTLYGFTNFTLAVFNVSDFKNYYVPIHPGINNVTECRYFGFREPITVSMNFGYSSKFWVIFSCCLLGVILYEHIVITICVIISYLIPNTPWSVFEKQKYEKVLIHEALPFLNEEKYLRKDQQVSNE